MNPVTKNISIGIGSTVVAVLIYLAGGATAANYGGAILTHLVDIVRGSQTSTAVVLNAPAWSFGIPIPTPIATSAATTSYANATSGLASSTPYSFVVAALDGTGTTTISNALTITTDASTTQPKPETINIAWGAVNGATGYAIFFATSSAPTSYSQYFLATTTGTYNFATSTGSIAGTNTLTVGTAFTELLNPNGPDVFNDNASSATSSVAASTTVAQFGGIINASASATTSACESDTAGAIFYNTANSHEWGCNGTAWTKIF